MSQVVRFLKDVNEARAYWCGYAVSQIELTAWVAGTENHDSEI